MITKSLIELIQKQLPTDLYIMPSQYGDLTVSTSEGDRYLRVPTGWEVREHTKGYGGWILSRGRTESFCRVMASPTRRSELIAQISAEKLDSRSPGTVSFIQEFIDKGISLLTFEEQLAREIARIILTLTLTSKGKEAQAKQAIGFSKGVSDFLTHFPVMLNPGQQLPFYRHTLAIDQAFDSGIREAVRDHVINTLTDMEGPSPIAEGKFGFDATATSKNTPGTWITTIKRNTPRRMLDGSLAPASPDAPVMLLASQPLIGNRKRGPREFGGLKHALPLVDPRPPEEFVRSGYEDYLTEDIRKCMTNVFTIFADIKDLNVYEHEGKTLNLDDILITPEGHTSLTTTIRERSIFTPEEWEGRKESYMNGAEAREGVSIQENLLLETSFEKVPLYRKEVIVTDADKPENWKVGKVLIDMMHKAMVSTVSHSLIAKDASGKEYPVEVVVSAASVKEKKIESIVLSATLARLNYGYISDPENYDYMVQEAKTLLEETGENPEGLLDIYKIGDDEWKTFVGKASGGWLRAIRLQENERSGSRVRPGAAIPVQTPLRHLVRKPSVLDTKTEHLVNTLAKTYRSLTNTAIVEEVV